MPPSPAQIARTILALLQARGPDKSVCPSDVARALDPADWRDLMEPVRVVARKLVTKGKLRITQKGKEVDPATARGAIRLRLP